LDSSIHLSKNKIDLSFPKKKKEIYLDINVKKNHMTDNKYLFYYMTWSAKWDLILVTQNQILVMFTLGGVQYHKYDIAWKQRFLL